MPAFLLAHQAFRVGSLTDSAEAKITDAVDGSYANESVMGCKSFFD